LLKVACLFSRSFSTALIGRKRQYEGKRISGVIIYSEDKIVRTKDCKNKRLIKEQREIAEKLFLSAQDRVQSFNKNGF